MASPGTFTLYSKNKDIINTAELAGATVKACLVTSSYTPDATVTGHYLYSDVSANEIANGNGYTTGGATVGTLASTAISGGYKFSSASPSWTASGGNIPAFRYVVFYVSGTFNGKTNPLIGYFVGDSAPADVPATSDGNPLTLTTPANGWFTAT